jgi:spore coat polysaccharide biosynthesis protein SpsF
MSKTIAIIQARMGSSRLPGKVLLDLSGQPMLVHVVERVRRANELDGFLVATTSDESDDPIEACCRQRGYPVFRGSRFDVLDRFYQAARQEQADVVVRITADCPVIDPQVINRTVSAFQASGVDFAADRLPPPWRRTFPIGLDTEVCSFFNLEKAWREADQPFHREHVMPFFYEGIPPDAFDLTKDSLVISPRGFRILLVNHVPDYGSLRWTVDTMQDLEFMRQIFNRLEKNDFTWQDLLGLLEREPDLADINQQVTHKSAFDVDARQESERVSHPLVKPKNWSPDD